MSKAFALPVNFRKQNINFLCKDDVLRIFRYLDSSEIARTVFPVCKTWYDIGRDPMLWKELNIDYMWYELDYSIERQILKVVQNATLLEVLFLSCVGDVSRILEYVGRFCPRLKLLNIQFCSVEDELSVETLVLGCPRLKDLFILNVHGSAFNDLAKFKRLESFEVDDADDWFDDTFLKRLSTNNRHLKSVTLDESEYYIDKRLVPLFQNLKSVLEDIHLDGSHCSSKTYGAIANCKELKDLTIENAVKLYDSDLSKLQALTKMTRISISNAKNISTGAFISFVANVKSPELGYFGFEQCHQVNRQLVNFLESHYDTILHKAKDIDLSRCKNVTDRLVELILKGNLVLEDLKLTSIPTLRGTAFNTTDTSIAPSLKTLNVSKCYRIRVSYLFTFRKKRQDLVIIFPKDDEFSR